MFGSPALEVALGLIFLYFVLALICSTANEVISTAVGLRAKFLQKGLLNLLSGALDDEKRSSAAKTLNDLFAHPLLNALIRPGKGPGPKFDPADSRRGGRSRVIRRTSRRAPSSRL